MPFAAVLFAGVSPFVFTTAALSADKVGSVLLSSGGLAEIVRTVDLAEGESRLALEIPADQADDVLKSLLVSDPGGTIVSVTIDGANSVAEAFKRLPLKREDLASTATIAAAMTGYAATIDDGVGHKASGIILGVGKVPRATEGQPIEVPAVTLRQDDGSFAEVLLGPGAGIVFADKDLQTRIDAAITAVRTAADTNFRTLAIETTGKGARTVRLSYVVAAPVWKAAYRIVPVDGGKYRVQGWAVLENGSGDDWTGVQLTLSSADPVALKQRLVDMYWRDRREVPLLLPGGPVDLFVDGAAAGGAREEMYDMSGDADMPAAAPAPMAMRAEVMPEPVAPSRGQEMVSVEGDVGVTFTLPQPVTLKAGATLTVPIIDADLDADVVSLWREGSGSAPQAAVFLSNTTGKSVPPGIFTVYGADGYLGDAQVAGIPPGEKRFAAFAADPKMRVTSERDHVETIVGFSARDGVLNVKRSLAWTTVYHLAAPKEEARTVMIDHARIAGTEVTSDGEVVSSEPERLRLRTDVPVGMTKDIRVTETRVDAEAVHLSDSSADTLLFYASTRGADPAVVEKLKAIAAIKTRVADAERAIERAERTIERQADEQERIRANLSALPETSDSAKSYIAKLTRSEKAIEEAEAARAEAQAKADRERAALDAAIAAF
ncbi:hypothetical protein CXZ10_02370 [Pleomorphomonas diazotrophica]|uniref:DUF4139 domain-containing protein n=1 Tax=Pleomorphomonas diazotrophica TaxID=1166257 RepID=A0A2N3M0I3_9HYPH|nr:DUF4139 domain-containing protein [Pleomorphomonas diazotrophica]PKR90254.1 hypothetical protein CXZ10_02370 [Pleomorphomonas diazotrophica]